MQLNMKPKTKKQLIGPVVLQEVQQNDLHVLRCF